MAMAVGGGLLVGAGAAWVLLHRHAREVLAWRVRRAVRKVCKRVQVVTTAEACDALLPALTEEGRTVGAVGLDCEWVQAEGQRRPVALLQLASSSGLCLLVRLTHLKHDIPSSLRDFLADESILKVGVGVLDDSAYLLTDYGLQVRGCVDLRHIAVSQQGGEGAAGLGLKALAQTYLGQTLDKGWRVRLSNWESSTLTKRQVEYAATDALVGVHILMVLLSQLVPPSSPWLPLLPLHYHLAPAIRHTCRPYADLKFSNKQNPGTVQNTKSFAPLKLKETPRGAPNRKGPLYYNCQLRAPDDQPLCTIDPKKARWYVQNGLGVLVSEDPLVVRLKFEPAGRPQLESEDGKFYLQTRDNVCVVCGKEDFYTRKSIVPHEYRKHFPKLLKHHQNHDVVLMCFPCHRKSNMLDNIQRAQLSKEFDAPLRHEAKAKATIDHTRKNVRNAARGLLKNRDNIPEERVAEMETLVKDYLMTDEPSVEQLHEVANIEVKIYGPAYKDHGRRVFEAYAKSGLSQLEQRWRQHFLDTMQPQHMPKCWSVNHNNYKMYVKMARLPLEHPDRDIYKMALVGTEGTINVPYNPGMGRKEIPSGVNNDSFLANNVHLPLPSENSPLENSSEISLTRETKPAETCQPQNNSDLDVDVIESDVTEDESEDVTDSDSGVTED